MAELTPAQQRALALANARKRRAEKKSIGLKEYGQGLAEPLATLISGSVAQPIAGIAGIGAAVMPGGKTGAEMVESVSSAMTYKPRSEVGQKTLETIAKPFEVVENYVDRVSERMGGGNPIASTAIKTAIYGLPALVGIRGRSLTRGKARQAVEEIDRKANELGVEIGSSEIRTQLGEAAAERSVTSRGEGMAELQNALRAARDAEKARADAAFEQARSMPAAIRAETVREFNLKVNEELASFDVDFMPIVQRRLAEISQLESLPAGSRVRLEAIDRYRRRLNRQRAAVSDKSQNKALDIIKGQLDEFVDSQFNQDMIIGDPEAVQAWAQARSMYSDYLRRFSDDKVIRQLVSNEATPETMRQWVMGASSTGAKREAGLVVKRLNEILGADSPAMKAMRQDFLYDVVEPLLSETPNLKAFIRNYDRVVSRNPSLVQELAPFSKTGLDDLRQFAGSAQKLDLGPQLTVDLNTLTARALFGHAIARAALRVGLASKAIEFLRGTGKSARREMMHDLVGADPNTPMIPKSSLAYGAIVAGEMNDVFSTEDPN